MIIEDNCFIGANSSVTEGVVVRSGAVIAMGVHLSASTKIIDRTSDNSMTRGRVPPGAVVVPGTIASPGSGGIATACAVIVKRVDAATRAKDFGERSAAGLTILNILIYPIFLCI